MREINQIEDLSKSMIATLQAENLSVVGDLAEVGIDCRVVDVLFGIIASPLYYGRNIVFT